MSGLTGNIAALAIGLQPSKGTAAVAAQHMMRITGGGIMPIKDTEDLLETTGDRMINDSYVKSVRGEGSPSFFVRPKFVGLLAYAALGAKAVSGSGDPYTHTFTLATSLPWLTVWRMLANGVWEKFVDCKVTKLHFESSATGVLTVTATFMGLSPSFLTSAQFTTDTTGLTAETADTILHADGHGALKVEATAIASIERFVLDIDNTGVLQYGDAVTGHDVTEARQVITAETTQMPSDFALWNRFHYDTATPTLADVPTRNVLELAGSPAGIDFKFTTPNATARSIEFLVPRLQIAQPTGLDANTDGAPLKMAVTYKAYKPASGSGLTIKVQNAQASYPAST